MAKKIIKRTKDGETLYFGTHTDAVLSEVRVGKESLTATLSAIITSFASYYTKSETYSQAEVDQLVSAIKQFNVVVASSLPTASASTMNTIYLIPSSHSEQGNVKDEFITIQDGGSYKWEQIGTTAIDLSGYSTTAEMNAAIASALSAYSTTSDMNAAIASAVESEEGRAKASVGYYVCDTAAGTAAKTVSATGYTLAVGGNMRIKMTNANTAANATLNINGTGAKALYYDCEQASSMNSWVAGDTLEVYYDGDKYIANSDSELRDYVISKKPFDYTHDQSTWDLNKLLKVDGTTNNSVTRARTSDFIKIPKDTQFIYTHGLYKNDAGVFIGLKFYTGNTVGDVITDNVASVGQEIPAVIDLSLWPTAKYVRFATRLQEASATFHFDGTPSGLVTSLIANEYGHSETKAVSQKLSTELANEVSRMTDAVDVTYDSSNSNLLDNTILSMTGATRSWDGFLTSEVLPIPDDAQYIETYGLYRNDAAVYIGLLLFDASGTVLPVVAGTNQPIPEVIDLSDYPTAKSLRWCTKGNAGAYVRCYSEPTILSFIKSVTDDEIGDSEDKLMSQKGINDALHSMAEEIKRNQYIALQSDDLTSDSGNWSFGSSWTYSANGATPSAVGESNYMRNTLIYYSDRRFMRVRVSMGIDTKLILTCSYGNTLNNGEGASAFGVDFAEKHLVIYGVPAYGGVSGDNQATSTGYDLTKIVNEVDIPESVIGAREYVIELHKHGSISKLILMDTKTGMEVSVAHNGWACGRQNQLYGFYCESGALPTLKDFRVYSQDRPDIVFTGDSITEGVYVDDRDYTYANRYRRDMPSRSVVVSARGGQTAAGLMPLFQSEWNIVRPKVISILIGANGGNTSATLNAFKDACDNIGATMIIHYCSCLRNGGIIAASNDTLIPEMGLEGARFDKATAIDNTPNATYSNINTALYGDAVHPNIDGQGEMFKRLDIDCPSLKL